MYPTVPHVLPRQVTILNSVAALTVLFNVLNSLPWLVRNHKHTLAGTQQCPNTSHCISLFVKQVDATRQHIAQVQVCNSMLQQQEASETAATPSTCFYILCLATVPLQKAMQVPISSAQQVPHHSRAMT